MKPEKRVEIPYGHLRHINWTSLIQEQIDIWDEIVISRDEKRTTVVVEYLGRE